MSRSQWFLAHSKQDDGSEVDEWCGVLAEKLSGDGWEATVIAGRDDYQNRSAALGGWSAWCRDVPCGTDYTGAPMYHGVIVPTDSLVEHPTVGKATFQIIDGFLSEGKHVLAWCPDSKAFRNITGMKELPYDDYTIWAELLFSE